MSLAYNALIQGSGFIYVDGKGDNALFAKVYSMARRMADPGAAKIGFVGAGVQARSHLEMFAAHFPLREAIIAGRGQTNIDLLAARAEALGLATTVAGTPREVLEQADIVVTSVTALGVKTPFLDAGWMKPGAFAAITDIGAPWQPETLGAFGRIVIDNRQQEAAMPKKLVDPALITADLLDVVSGKMPMAHERSAPSAFMFRGIAVGDFAIAALAWEKSQQR